MSHMQEQYDRILEQRFLGLIDSQTFIDKLRKMGTDYIWKDLPEGSPDTVGDEEWFNVYLSLADGDNP